MGGRPDGRTDAFEEEQSGGGGAALFSLPSFLPSLSLLFHAILSLDNCMFCQFCASREDAHTNHSRADADVFPVTSTLYAGKGGGAFR